MTPKMIDGMFWDTRDKDFEILEAERPRRGKCINQMLKKYYSSIEQWIVEQKPEEIPMEEWIHFVKENIKFEIVSEREENGRIYGQIMPVWINKEEISNE